MVILDGSVFHHELSWQYVFLFWVSIGYKFCCP